jgi:hypothetical protein
MPIKLMVEDDERLVDRWTLSVRAQAERAQRFADQVAALTSTATGRRDAVAVTVAGSGVIVDLGLHELTRSWSARELAEEILAVIRRAQAGLADQVAAAAEHTIGTDAPATAAVLAGYRARFPPSGSVAEEGGGGRASHA